MPWFEQLLDICESLLPSCGFGHLLLFMGFWFLGSLNSVWDIKLFFVWWNSTWWSTLPVNSICQAIIEIFVIWVFIWWISHSLSKFTPDPLCWRDNTNVQGVIGILVCFWVQVYCKGSGLWFKKWSYHWDLWVVTGVKFWWVLSYHEFNRDAYDVFTSSQCMVSSGSLTNKKGPTKTKQIVLVLFANHLHCLFHVNVMSQVYFKLWPILDVLLWDLYWTLCTMCKDCCSVITEFFCPSWCLLFIAIGSII